MGDRMDVPLPKSSYDLDIVLVGINHPGNLGAICRTMLNHGFDKLSMVSPNCSPDDEEARNRAKHSGRILDSVTVYDTLQQATSSSSLVVGTSGKREVGSKVLKRHFVLPWEFAEMLRDFEGKVSLVFGEEGKACPQKISTGVISCSPYQHGKAIQSQIYHKPWDTACMNYIGTE